MKSAQQVVVAEYRNRFITWISDGSSSRIIGDEEWVADALDASSEGRIVNMFDGSFSYEANVHEVENMVSVFAGLASFPLEEIRIRECSYEFKESIKDAIQTDFFADMIGKNLSSDEWVDFLSSATYELDPEERWTDKGHSLKQFIKLYNKKYER